MGLFEKVFGSYSERELKKLTSNLDKIDSFEEGLKKLSNEELKLKTEEFKNRINNEETLDDLLPEAFAVVREASVRVLGLRHFREQLMGGIVLHQGRISEMKTGEGKTLVATLPAYLNALSGNGVHIVTVNDYLAKRDSEEMGSVYEFLGLKTGVIVHGLTNIERREAYNCDITYGTNNEFGFDYLRDNMVVYKRDKVQRVLNYCIVDEVDSILIDEARTPLIISGEGDKSTDFYKVADFFAKSLKSEDYTVDEKSNSVILTEEGLKKAEKYYHLENYADAENMQIQHHTVQALKGNYTMKKDIDYMVKDDEVIIVDEFTGRLMEGRRYSDGLHQAIEAKENVKIQKESKTLATITFQNYFRMYDKLSGMTGTAQTEENEFREIYGLDVIVIPTHEPIARQDTPDLVYKTQVGKFKAIVNDIAETYKTGQPMLVGTVSIETSELLSALLKKKGIPHKVLNAKYHEMEAEIISHAGEKGGVTIATNMAGRGTDIKLGEGVVEVGGLKVIGTERHESRRIDNQLRGRSGRQGDPGFSRFYVSLEDDLMRIFASERFQSIVEKLGLDDDDVIESKMVTSAIESAQKKVEGNNFDIRKNVLQYDDVMNQQREVIYGQRAEVLEGEDLKAQLEKMMEEVIYNAVNTHMNSDKDDMNEDIQKLLAYLEEIYLPKNIITIEEIKSMNIEEVKAKLISLARDLYDAKEAQISSEQMREIERVILLRVVDTKWMAHIDDMDHLRRGIGLRAYRQQDPVQAYQFEGSQMFDAMIHGIEVDTIKYLFHVHIQKAPEREQVAKETTTNKTDDSLKKEPKTRKDKKVGRNEPCPCGSGKKYKNCHGLNE
ncbi:preprotein translocase subunit SecA [Clostridium grantii]|uniref:Protein translocase subunit SecA n=1 Tax=Clostridium grantii DSM 8605 TaxID=1121316 RepID=A0A1M5TIV8_9CLOT|nr:preprotein translocase subunit SecA [Clostridium grantii]SHH50303.1 protein translocase subunit secA [Clostridium grantii DSM 8605]